MSMQTPMTPPSRISPDMFSMAGAIKENLKAVHDSWFCFVLLGVFLAVLGAAAMAYAGIATITTVLVFGYLMLAAGVFYVVGAFFTRCWGGFFLSLLAGVLHGAVGLIIVDRPVEAVLLYTLVMAVFFFVEGLFRIVGSLFGQFQHRGWMLFNGIVTLVLGVMIWRQWPVAGLFVVGLFLGINLVVSGLSYISMGLAARRLPVS